MKYGHAHARALNKPTILLARRGRELPFDIRSYRVIFYDDTNRRQARGGTQSDQAPPVRASRELGLSHCCCCCSALTSSRASSTGAAAAIQSTGARKSASGGGGASEGATRTETANSLTASPLKMPLVGGASA